MTKSYKVKKIAESGGVVLEFNNRTLSVLGSCLMLFIFANCMLSCVPETELQVASETAFTDVEGIGISVSSDFFRPALYLSAPATIYIDWGDGQSIDSTEAGPGDHFFDKHDFIDSAPSHVVRLWVKPWSSLSVLNLGFRAGDGGNNQAQTDAPVISLYPPSSAFSGVDDSDTLDADRIRGYVGTVTAINNLQVATSLEAFCCEQQAITRLDCSDLASLRTVEAFYSQVKETNFQGCAALRRCCLESTGANTSWRVIDGQLEESAALDLRDSPLLQDIRGTGDDHDLLVIHPDALDSLWHLCKMGNSRKTMIQIGDEPPAKLDLTRFAALTQCWISFSPVLQDLVMTNGVTYSFWLRKCGIGSVDIHGQTQIQELDLTENNLNSINISGCTGLGVINMGYCDLSESMIDQFLDVLDALGIDGESWRSVNLADTDDTTETMRNSPPSAAGLVHVANLRSRGWTVTVNE